MTWGYAGGDTRFQVMLPAVLDHRHIGVMIKADLADDDPRADTLIPVYAGANWHEREAAEMFGIGFDDHPDLRHSTCRATSRSPAAQGLPAAVARR